MAQAASFSSIDIPAAARAWAITLVALIPALWLFWHGQLYILVTLAAFLLLQGLCMSRPWLGICVTLAYLFLLGDIRRIFGILLGFPKLDPLLLVGPAVSALLGIPLLLRFRLNDSISKVIFALMVIMTLEIFNPRQGGIVVGLSGALFYLIPLLWFWIGRRYGTDALLSTVLYKVVFPLSLLAAILGLCQAYIGFLPWESAWIAAVSDHYHALNLGGGFIRSFGFSVNGTEYADLLLVGSTFTLSAFFAGRRIYGLFFPIIATALFLASSRTTIVKLLFAVAASWALSSKGGKGFAVRLPLGFAVGIGILAFALSQTSGGRQSEHSAAGYSTQHQLQGLSHPLDSRYSTASMHSQMFLTGIVEGFTNPIGKGIGTPTIGSAKFSSGPSREDDSDINSSEVDIGDAFLSMGFVGGFLYLTTYFLVLRRAIAFGRTASKQLGLPAIGLLAAMGGSWIALGQYGIAPLIWFVIGTISRPRPGEMPAIKRSSMTQRAVPSSSGLDIYGDRVYPLA